MKKTGITSHVLDTSRGAPAAGIKVSLEMKISSASWQALGSATTNADGRVGDLLVGENTLKAAIYRLHLETGSYFSGLGVKTFYPQVSIEFEVSDPAQHYHVPLLISPFGYSTYRGS